MANHASLKGRSLHAPSTELIENQTGALITKLKVVSLDGMGTVYPKVIINNASINTPFGIATADIANGTSGQIFCLGLMTEVDTSLWPTGTVLYSDNAGNLSTTANQDIVATVIKQDAVFGIMYVYPLASFIVSGAGSVALGVANRLALYPQNGTGVDDVLIQNGHNIDLAITAQATRTVPLEYLIPNPGDAITSASFVLTEGAQAINGNKTFNNNVYLSALTPGSILFIGASGLVTQNAANLFYDNALNRFGIGINAPEKTVHIKSHSNYIGSGVQVETFATTLASTAYQTIYSYDIIDPTISNLEFTVNVRQADGSERASFVRTGLFYNEGSGVFVQDSTWQSDFTSRSNTAFDVTYELLQNTIFVKGKGANLNNAYWTGSIKVEKVSTSANTYPAPNADPRFLLEDTGFFILEDNTNLLLEG